MDLSRTGHERIRLRKKNTGAVVSSYQTRNGISRWQRSGQTDSTRRWKNANVRYNERQKKRNSKPAKGSTTGKKGFVCWEASVYTWYHDAGLWVLAVEPRWLVVAETVLYELFACAAFLRKHHVSPVFPQVGDLSLERMIWTRSRTMRQLGKFTILFLSSL